MMDDLVTNLRAVSVLDTALDREAMAVDEYAETRDPELVRLLPGMAARVVTLRPLQPAEVAGAEAMPGSSMGASVSLNTAMFAFRCAVVRIESFRHPGVAMEPTGPVTRIDDREYRFWNDSDIAAVQRGLGMAFIHEMGQLAFQRAMSGNFWGGSAAFTLPLSCTRALDLIALRRAALERRSASTGSSEPSAEGSTPEPQPSSGAGIGAGATAGIGGQAG